MSPRAYLSPMAATATIAVLIISLLLIGCSAQDDSSQAHSALGQQPGSALPVPDSLPSLQELAANAPRTVSDDELELPGDLVYQMSPEHVSLDNALNTATFSPPPGQLAWTIQQFSVGMFHEVGSVGCTVSGIEEGEKVWIFVSDFPNNRWKALPGQGNGSSSVDLGSVQEVYSDGQSMFVAIVSFGASFTLEFTSVVLTNVEGFPGWYHNWGTTGWDFANSVAVESDGNVLFGGQIDGQAISGGEHQERLLGLLRFSPEGELLDSRSYSWPSPDDEFGPADCIYGDMLLGSGGEIYLVGSCSDGNFGSTRGMVLRLDSALEPVWSRLYYESSNRIELAAATFDSFGNLVCAGTRRGDAFGVTDDALLLVLNSANGDILLDRVAIHGNTEFVAQETISCLDIDPMDNRVMLSGYMYVGDSPADACTLSLDGTSGDLQWAASFGDGSTWDTSNAVVRGPAGTTIVASKLEGGAGPAYNTIFLTISNLGQMAGLHSYSDSTAEGLYVRSLSTLPLDAGFVALGSRVDTDLAFESPSSIIPFDYSMVPLGGTDYSFYFDAAAFGNTHLYCASFFTDDMQQNMSGTVTSVSGGSCSEVIGVGSFFSLIADDSDAGLFFEPFEALDEDVAGSLDAPLTDGDFDMFAAGLEL